MPYFAVQYTYADAPDEIHAHRPDHRAFLRELLGDGILLAAGAYTDEPPGALLLFESDSAEAIQSILQGDPFAQNALITEHTIRAWSAAIGPWAP